MLGGRRLSEHVALPGVPLHAGSRFEPTWSGMLPEPGVGRALDLDQVIGKRNGKLRVLQVIEHSLDLDALPDMLPQLVFSIPSDIMHEVRRCGPGRARSPRPRLEPPRLRTVPCLDLITLMLIST